MNMAYIRFENTIQDLMDCERNMEDTSDLSESEAQARLELIRICIRIADDYSHEID